MLIRWYRTGVIYSVDVGLFQDGNLRESLSWQELGLPDAHIPPDGSWTSTAGSGTGADAASDIFCCERELDRRFLIPLDFSSHRVPLALGDDAPAPRAVTLSGRVMWLRAASSSLVTKRTSEQERWTDEDRQ